MAFDTVLPAQATGLGNYTVDPIFTVGETIDGYTPPGILDGIGAFELDNDTVRVLVNHELLNFQGYDYTVSDGQGSTFNLDGARISFFDINKQTFQIEDSGLAYDLIYNANGNIATDITFLQDGFVGFSRFCSSVLVEAEQFGEGRGLEDTIYFAGEEDGGFFNPVGGAMWALDVETDELWQVPAFGRGAWENVTEVNTGTADQVAFILADDSAPFDFDSDGVSEPVPAYLYVGTKDASGDFLDRNGLRDGQLYVWVSDTGETTPADFNDSGSLEGRWVAVDNDPEISQASENGASGFDEYGYPTQGNLVTQAEALGAFGFSRPKDVATNPEDGSEVVLASTGVDTFENGVDSFGTIYTLDTDFSDLNNLTGTLSILYDGDADSTRALRSPDNLDWADDGFIYVQEDEAEETAASGEPLFGDGAANPNEAGIVRIDPDTGEVTRIANIDRSVVVDGSLANPFDAVDTDAGDAGEWESSGILDVSALFGQEPGTLFLFDVQAHGIVDQTDFNSASRISDDDLVEGGQLAFLVNGGLVVNAGRGRDEIIGLATNDELLGGGGNDTIEGGDGKDILEGGRGRDRLFGGEGRDRLMGEEGNDKLTGGEGRDRFMMIRSSDATDVIRDFELGADLIDLRRLQQRETDVNRADLFDEGVITIGGNERRAIVFFDSDGDDGAEGATRLFKVRGVAATDLTVDNFRL